MIVALIAIADPRLLLVVAGYERGIKGADLRLDRRPFALAVTVFGFAGLETAFVAVRARIADVLVAVGFGKEHAQADAARRLSGSRIEAFRARDRGAEHDDILERRRRVLRIRRRRLHDAEELHVLVEQRLVVGVEIGRRDAELVGPPDF